jgi:hypothetical protein
MGEYFCGRVWELRSGASRGEVEQLATSGVLEMQRWIPGVKHVSLVRLNGDLVRYMMTLTFTDQSAYTYWKQVEEEASDYWERFASVQFHWEQLCSLVAEYAGETVMNVRLLPSDEKK